MRFRLFAAHERSSTASKEKPPERMFPRASSPARRADSHGYRARPALWTGGINRSGYQVQQLGEGASNCLRPAASSSAPMASRSMPAVARRPVEPGVGRVAVQGTGGLAVVAEGHQGGIEHVFTVPWPISSST